MKHAFHRTKSLLVLLLVMAVLMTSNPLLTPTQAQDDPQLTIVATHSILQNVVAMVAGERAVVVSMIPVGGDPHTFAPSAQDILTIDGADLIFMNGALFEEGLIEILEEASSDNLITVSSCVNILPSGNIGIDLHEDHDDDHDEHDESHEEEHEVHETHVFFEDIATRCDQHFSELELVENPASLGHLYEIDCEEGHAEGGCDAHVWMNIDNVMLWTIFVRDTLSEVDPDNAKTYAENAAQFLAELEALDQSIEAQIATIPAEDRILVTNHDVLGYFANRYDFDVVGTVLGSASTGGESSAQDILNVIEIINFTESPAIFTDSTVSSDTAQQIANETGAEILPLYTGSLSTNDEPASTYIDYMQFNVDSIVNGLSQ